MSLISRTFEFDEHKVEASSLEFYGSLLDEIKNRIRRAQVKAALSANAEMIALYWDIGKLIFNRQKQEGWGAGVIPRLAKDIKNELPELKGFSERNIKFMVQLFKEYESDAAIGKQAVSQLENVKRLVSQILPDPQSDLAQQSLKDPYIFDFLTLTEPFKERELETELVKHLEKFLLELGVGFAFVGRQYHMEISDKDFYIDLLFYHLKLRCYIVVELKKGDFKPEYAGKMNFYCSAVDDILKHQSDQPTIGLIMCQTRDRILAEYALRDVNKPIGVSEYELTRALPENLKSSLPSIEEIEAELGKAG